MSSINTNASAMTALQSLNATNKNLSTVQSRISTGMRVSQASDNAAYWSIATTMRSDNKALSTVQDALGLGAAQVDVAYTAMDSVKDKLDEIKTKLVAASQPGVDKSKIQSEISQLQSNIKSIAESASFSGGNWLSVDSSAAGYEGTKNVVGSFTRDGSGNISIGTIGVDVSNTALFDKGGAGLLEVGSGNTKTGTLAESGTSGVISIAGSADGAEAAVLETAGITYGAAAAASFDLTVGGVTAKIEFTSGADRATTITAINEAIEKTALKGLVSAGAGTAAGALAFTTTARGESATVELSDVTAGNLTGLAAVAEVKGADTGAGATKAAAAMIGKFEAMTFDDDDSISFKIDIDGTSHNIKIDKATIATTTFTAPADGDAATGEIKTVTGMIDVLEKAFANANLPASKVTITEDAAGNIMFESQNATPADGKIAISDFRASSGAADFDIMGLDITNASTDQLKGYVQGVENMIKSVTTAASDLGAIKSRIDSQKEFTTKIMDAVDRGVGQLVDADMTKESARLSALQVQQQLGIQALSIANSNTQNILSLFR